MNTENIITFTRQQYINNKCTHSEYYGQFVNEGVKNIVLLSFTYHELNLAYQENKNFNTAKTKLSIWDELASKLNYLVVNPELFKQAHDCLQLSTKVCILKEASRQIIENN